MWCCIKIIYLGCSHALVSDTCGAASADVLGEEAAAWSAAEKAAGPTEKIADGSTDSLVGRGEGSTRSIVLSSGFSGKTADCSTGLTEESIDWKKNIKVWVNSCCS